MCPKNNLFKKQCTSIFEVLQNGKDVSGIKLKPLSILHPEITAIGTVICFLLSSTVSVFVPSDYLYYTYVCIYMYIEKMWDHIASIVKSPVFLFTQNDHIYNIFLYLKMS